jgi:hypothetical protein
VSLDVQVGRIELERPVRVRLGAIELVHPEEDRAARVIKAGVPVDQRDRPVEIGKPGSKLPPQRAGDALRAQRLGLG